MNRYVIGLILSLICLPLFGQNNVDFEARFKEYGLVEISELDPTIGVLLRYSTPDNFIGRDMYGDLERAYFAPEIAAMIVWAQQKLKAVNPDYSLLIYDASRPISIQRRMFSHVAGTPLNIYVANPAKGGGRHNYGLAVDLTIVDKKGKPLDMGSEFDFFAEASHVGSEADLVRRGVITSQAQTNRALLTRLMNEAGFVQHPKEWWHFHKYSIAEAKAKYKLLNF